MSRVFDLLDNVKIQPDAKDIHPALKEAVFASREQYHFRRRNVLLGLFAISSIAVGAGVNIYLDGLRPTRQPAPAPQQKPLKIAVPKDVTPITPVSPVAGFPQAAASVQHETISPKVETTEGQAKLLAPVSQQAALTKPKVIPQAKPVDLPPVVRQPAPVTSAAMRSAPVATAKVNAPLPREEVARPLSDASQKDRYLLMAREMEAKRDFEQALKYCRQALELAPDNYRLLNNIAGLSLQTGQVREASAAAQKALKLKRDFLPALINLGIAEARLGNQPQAMVSFARAFSLDPANREVMYNMALLQERSGNLDEATEYYRRLSESGEVKGSLGLGRVLEKQQKAREAIAVYREVLASSALTARERATAEDRLARLTP